MATLLHRPPQRPWLARADVLADECNRRFRRWHARVEAASSDADSYPLRSPEYLDCRVLMRRAIRAMEIYNRRHAMLARAITRHVLEGAWHK